MRKDLKNSKVLCNRNKQKLFFFGYVSFNFLKYAGMHVNVTRYSLYSRCCYYNINDLP